MDPATGGKIEIHGIAVRLSHPADAMKLGMAYLSEDRKREGLYLTKTIKENFMVTNLKRIAPRAGWIGQNSPNSPKGTQIVLRYVHPALTKNYATYRAATSKK